MKILLLSGFGPIWPASSFWEANTLAGTFFDQTRGPVYHAGLDRHLALTDFGVVNGDTTTPLFRSRTESEPHLTTFTLTSILESTGREFEMFDLGDVWSGSREPLTQSPDVIGLSTTFLCNWKSLVLAVRWIRDRFPKATLVVGGQYSNLKFARILKMLDVDYVIRGDAEIALPRLLDVLGGDGHLGSVPNLVIGGGGAGGALRRVEAPAYDYIDVNAHPSPRFSGSHRVIPYESMRGCPFSCKFCSFPAASPKWRYKSAEKIREDWQAYVDKNGASLIRALDSTFTVPPARFQELLATLPGLGIPWDAYTRADVIRTSAVVDALESSNCASLSIGFESMSDASLTRMHKQVNATKNRRANELLANSEIDYRGSFMIGYPGETPEEFAETHRFLVNDYASNFILNPFTLIDETMPVWDDAEKYNLALEDSEDPDSAWTHSGMDRTTARDLHRHTIKEVRWKNDRAVPVLWQIPFDRPFVPRVVGRENLRVEKVLERLAFAPIDFEGDAERVRTTSERLLTELDRTWGVKIGRAPNDLVV